MLQPSRNRLDKSAHKRVERRAAIFKSSFMASLERSVDLKTQMLIIVVVITDVFGNLTMSWGVKRGTAFRGFSPLFYMHLIFNPWVLLGAALLLLWLLSRMILFSWADLSYVLPITSFSYVFNEVTGHYLLGEQISWARWLGTVMITAGAAVVGLTQSNTTAGPMESAL